MPDLSDVLTEVELVLLDFIYQDEYFYCNCQNNYNNFSIRGAPWSVANRLQGQRTGASWSPWFRSYPEDRPILIHPTHSCAPDGRCDLVSSVFISHSREVLLYFLTCDQSLLALTCMLTSHRLYPWNIAMIIYTKQQH